MAEHLVVFHYHLRPGGVRRVIEIALPAIAREMNFRRITLATGEAAPDEWLGTLRRLLPGVAVREFVEPMFRYASEQRVKNLRGRIGPVVRTLTSDADVAWFHNPSLARNVPLVEAVRDSGIRAVFHHHDLWVDNRWSRWPELRAMGYRSLAHVGRAIFPPESCHATINRLDHAVIKQSSDLAAGWFPNPVGRGGAVPVKDRRAARRWLTDRLGDDAPVWIFPTRFLRRKNLAESLLLARWLRPESWLVTTAAVSSRDEIEYARRLQAACRKHAWRARFGILANEPGGAPGVGALVAASEAVMMTSVQEGFGLPCLEAIAAGRPLIARRLPNVMPDLNRLGFRIPYLYDDVLVSQSLFDATAEKRRQESVFARWRRQLPAGVRRFACGPVVTDGRPVPFSHLTLTAQLEVLAVPAAEAWNECRKWNPVLERVASDASGQSLVAEPWPDGAAARLDPATYAKAFRRALAASRSVDRRAGEVVQQAFIEQRLGRDFVFPILIE